MTTALVAALVLCCLGSLGTGFFAGVETGAYRFNRTRHRVHLAAGEPRARLVERLTVDMASFVTVCLIGTNLATSLVSFSATLAFEGLDLVAPEVLATLLIGPVLFVLGEVAPKELYRRHADRLVYASAPLLRLAAGAFAPATALLAGVNRLLRGFGLQSDESGSRLEAQERLRQEIAAGHQEGTLTSYQATLAGNIFGLSAIRVRQVMIPLPEVAALEAAAALEDARAQVTAGAFTRYPVYRHRRERVTGVVSAWDLLFEERPGLTIRNYVEPIHEVGPDEPIPEALLRLRQRRAKIAVVVAAEGRRAVGIVTLKDLVEEITGELKDL